MEIQGNVLFLVCFATVPTGIVFDTLPPNAFAKDGSDGRDLTPLD